MNFFINMAMGTISGIITGFGVGGGTLLVLYLTLFAGFSQSEAVGINLVYFIPCAVASLILHIKNKNVEVKYALFSAGFGTVSALIASHFATKGATDLLSKIFGIFLIGVGACELVSVFGKKGKG